MCAFAISGCLLVQDARAQFTYTFTAVSGSYAQVSASGSDLNSIETDDAHSSAITLPFDFGYNGVLVNSIRVNSNGWISMDDNDSPSATTGRNNSSFGGANSDVRPGIFPLWDDLDGVSGTARYEVTGSAPNRVFTMEWRNWQWDWQATGNTISFECKLYETTNVIEFIYRQESGAVNNSSSGASIGLLASNSGTYYSLNGTGTSPTASTSTATTNLSTKPATGQIYRFTPSCGTTTSISGTTSNSPICATSTLNLNTVAAGTAPLTYAWTGTGTFSDATISNPSVTGAATGTYSVVVRNWCGTIANGSTAVTVNPAPTTSNAGPDQTICTTTASVTLAANTPSVGTAAWTVLAGSPSTSLAQFSSTTSPSATFTPAGGAGNYTLRWTISSSPCTPSTNDVVITVNAPPATANAGADQTICAAGSATLAANSASPGTGAWTVLTGSPSTSSSQFSSTSNPTATFTPNGGAGTYTLRWTTSRPPCASTQDDVVITANPSPTVSNAGPDQTICAFTSATLAANAPVVGAGAWSIMSAPSGGSTSTAQLSSTTATNAVFTPSAAVAGAYTLRWSISNAPCATSTNDVVINVDASPTTPVMTPTSATTCAGFPQVLGAASTTNGTVPQAFTSSGGPATVSASGANNASIYPWNITTSGLPVSGVSVGSVTINGITHTFPDDLDILLQSPTGTNVILISDAGGGGNITNVNYTFNDASPALSDGSTNATGSYHPGNFTGTGDETWSSPGPGAFSQASPSLSLFTGNMNGAWKLMIRDDENADAGSITSWSITFNLPATVSYLWTPNVALSGTTGPSVTASPTSTQTYTVTALHDANSCTRSNSVTITVNPLPVMTCGSYGPVCVDAADIALGGSPSGGTWSGTGVSGSTFDPSVGTQTLTYSYTDGNGCVNSCTTTITVNPLPVVTCGSYGPACSSDPDIALGGSPAGGTWSGTGVSGNSFDPGVGTQTVTYSYTDGNGCSASCNTTINVTMATAWYSDVDHDGFGDPGSLLMACSQPTGYITDNSDNCPTLFGLIGDACDDANPFTTGDVITAACVCAGIPVPCDTWSLVINTDGNGAQTSWQMKDATSPYVLDSGGPYPSNATITENICVPQGACFDLIFADGACDGITNGGWVLRDNNNRRVIDNAGNGAGFTCTAAADQEFCSPVSTTALTIASCDRMDWFATDYIVVSPDVAVSAQWGNGNPNDDGYQFWFFNPLGGYNRRILHTHAVSMGYGPPSATRACHMPLSLTPNPIPLSTLLNVRVRSMVNGVYGPFGPACRFMMIAVPPSCPTTQLDNNPLHVGTTYSCGVTGKVVASSGNSGKIWALPVTGGCKYKFRFSITSEGYSRNIISNTYALTLGDWDSTPLLCGTYTYDVKVAVSTDCTTFCPFGPVCTVEITNNTASACDDEDEDEDFSGGSLHFKPVDTDAALRLWPNPNNGQQVQLLMESLEENLATATVEITDLFGKIVRRDVIALDGSTTLNTVMELDGELAKGVYTVTVLAGSGTFTKRLVIE